MFRNLESFGSLQLATVGVFTPQKLADARNQLLVFGLWFFVLLFVFCFLVLLFFFVLFFCCLFWESRFSGRWPLQNLLPGSVKICRACAGLLDLGTSGLVLV